MTNALKIVPLYAVFVICGWMAGCALKRQQQIHPRGVVVFRNVRDGKCKVLDVQLDAVTGEQVVICE